MDHWFSTVVRLELGLHGISAMSSACSSSFFMPTVFTTDRLFFRRTFKLHRHHGQNKSFFTFRHQTWCRQFLIQSFTLAENYDVTVVPAWLFLPAAKSATDSYFQIAPPRWSFHISTLPWCSSHGDLFSPSSVSTRFLLPNSVHSRLQESPDPDWSS